MEAVLDTNIWLDLLVFGDPVTQALGHALESRRVRVPAQPRMRDELVRVLAYPKLALGPRARAQALAGFDRYVTMLEPPWLASPAASLTCRDPDDQMFVDLALARRAAWLVSRDRQVLALRRVAARHGLQVVRPDDSCWLAALAGPAAAPNL